MTFWLSDDGTPIIKPCLQQVNCFHTYHLANVIVSSLEQSHEMFRYDMIRDATFTCAQKMT